MRYLGLDLGTKTLGVAISDKTGLIASPYETKFYENYEELITYLEKLIKEKEIQKIILGYPKNMNNTLGDAVKRTEEFKKLILQNITIPLILVDERLSTVEALKNLIDMDMSRKKRKKVIDSYAAAIILDTYLKEEGRKIDE